MPPAIPIGRLLEISVPAPDIRESLDFYRRLGFVELPVNDIRTWYYAVVTDGSIHIGLHGGGGEEPTLTFVHPDLRRSVATLESAGAEILNVRLGDDEFNEVTVATAGGTLLHLEARTFSPGPPEDAAAPVLGRAVELGIRTSNPAAGLEFWEATGMTVLDADADPLKLTGGALPAGLDLGLYRNLPGGGPVVRYRLAGAAAKRLGSRLKELEISPRRQGDSLWLTAPEGTKLVVDLT